MKYKFSVAKEKLKKKKFIIIRRIHLARLNNYLF